MCTFCHISIRELFKHASPGYNLCDFARVLPKTGDHAVKCLYLLLYRYCNSCSRQHCNNERSNEMKSFVVGPLYRFNMF